MEALTCSRLNDNCNIIASFIGVYSTCEHPFALVFEFMDQLNLREYLRNNRDIRRVELVRFRRRGCRFRLSHYLDVSCWRWLVA